VRRTRSGDGLVTDHAVEQSEDNADPIQSGRLQTLLQDGRFRFLGIGAINTGFAFLVFAVLQATVGHSVNYMIVLLIAHVLGVLEAFVLYRLMVFRVKGNVLLDLARFESVYVVALGVNAALLPVLVEFGHLPVILSQGVIVVFTSAVSYLGHKHFSFRRPRTLK
jgi:putative flippase GtrA